MNTVTCIQVSNYAHAITRGKVYLVLAEKEQLIHIEDDRDKRRWFPLSCFISGNHMLWKMHAFNLDDTINDPLCDEIEVTITLKRDTFTQQRWCYFVTPTHLQKCLASSRSFLQLGQHGLIVGVLNEEIIGQVLYNLEAQNELESFPILST